MGEAEVQGEAGSRWEEGEEEQEEARARRRGANHGHLAAPSGYQRTKCSRWRMARAEPAQARLNTVSSFPGRAGVWPTRPSHRSGPGSTHPDVGIDCHHC